MHLAECTGSHFSDFLQLSSNILETVSALEAPVSAAPISRQYFLWNYTHYFFEKNNGKSSYSQCYSYEVYLFLYWCVFWHSKHAKTSRHINLKNSTSSNINILATKTWYRIQNQVTSWNSWNFSHSYKNEGGKSTLWFFCTLTGVLCYVNNTASCTTFLVYMMELIFFRKLWNNRLLSQ